MRDSKACRSGKDCKGRGKQWRKREKSKRKLYKSESARQIGECV